MEIISSLIPLFVIISIVFSIISKAKQAQNKTSVKGPATKPAPSKNSSLQEIIRQQIEEQRKAASGIQSQNVRPAAPPKPTVIGEGNFANTASLENRPTEMQRHSHGGHLNEPYNEGDALNRATLEGSPVEMQRHSHNVHRGGSYNEGDKLNRTTLEGSPILEYEDKFDLDEEARVSRTAKKSTKAKKQALVKSGTVEFKIDKRSIVNGIIMSEILNKRGGRRALR